MTPIMMRQSGVLIPSEHIPAFFERMNDRLNAIQADWNAIAGPVS